MFKSLLFIILLIPVFAIGQQSDHNLWEQGPLDTLTGAVTITSNTVWFGGGQRGAATVRGHLTKLSGDNKTVTLSAVLFFDPADVTDKSDVEIIGTQAVTTTPNLYSYSLANFDFWGICKGFAIIYSFTTGGTDPAIEIKGKALTK